MLDAVEERYAPDGPDYDDGEPLPHLEGGLDPRGDIFVENDPRALAQKYSRRFR